MMTLPEVQVHRPGTVREAVALLASKPNARVLAGGTDLVPNLKYGMYETEHLVALRGLSKELRYVRVMPASSAKFSLAEQMTALLINVFAQPSGLESSMKRICGSSKRASGLSWVFEIDERSTPITFRATSSSFPCSP